MRQVLFLPNSLIPRTEHARWVGKPRASWLIETFADAYKESVHIDQFDMNKILQRTLVNESAQQRLNNFSWCSISYLFIKSFMTESFVTGNLVIESGHIPSPASEIMKSRTLFVLFCFYFFLLVVWQFDFSLLFRDSEKKSCCCRVRKFSFILQADSLTVGFCTLQLRLVKCKKMQKDYSLPSCFWPRGPVEALQSSAQGPEGQWDIIANARKCLNLPCFV